ncbi:addiction module protein [Sorangium sp. So ce176]|uniref:addiction module protein n=1 Tax=Sorangium sp. So ce176 TaxID=3133286 RepID=UPI003F6341C0
MAHPTRDILAAALSLPEGERLRLASELIASVEEPYDDAWNAAWLEELERREQAVRDRGTACDARASETSPGLHPSVAVSSVVRLRQGGHSRAPQKWARVAG